VKVPLVPVKDELGLPVLGLVPKFEPPPLELEQFAKTIINVAGKISINIDLFF
jgi:hypothetical protein